MIIPISPLSRVNLNSWWLPWLKRASDVITQNNSHSSNVIQESQLFLVLVLVQPNGPHLGFLQIFLQSWKQPIECNKGVAVGVWHDLGPQFITNPGCTK